MTLYYTAEDYCGPGQHNGGSFSLWNNFTPLTLRTGYTSIIRTYDQFINVEASFLYRVFWALLNLIDFLVDNYGPVSGLDKMGN